MKIPESAIKWLANGERGVSSNAMFQAITGIPTEDWGGLNHPWDPSDFIRCERLLTAVPEFRNQLDKVAALSPRWKNLVEHWEEIRSLIYVEAPEWDKGIGSAPKAYALMKRLTA